MKDSKLILALVLVMCAYFLHENPADAAGWYELTEEECQGLLSLDSSVHDINIMMANPLQATHVFDTEKFTLKEQDICFKAKVTMEGENLSKGNLEVIYRRKKPGHESSDPIREIFRFEDGRKGKHLPETHRSLFWKKTTPAKYWPKEDSRRKGLKPLLLVNPPKAGLQSSPSSAHADDESVRLVPHPLWMKHFKRTEVSVIGICEDVYCIRKRMIIGMNTEHELSQEDEKKCGEVLKCLLVKLSIAKSRVGVSPRVAENIAKPYLYPYLYTPLYTTVFGPPKASDEFNECHAAIRDTGAADTCSPDV